MPDEKKAAAKKPNLFARAGGGVVRYLREMRSELKKVVWPGRKQLTNSTIIVVVAVLVVGIAIAILDVVSNTALNEAVKFLRQV
ncbi:MAG: preprotein translocase subunit SecE [Oscillospiraceae bacterium]|nr:preprotein translocase subunit SecE [Oscillospiraceae bacterium]